MVVLPCAVAFTGGIPDLGVVDEVPAFVHEEVVRRPRLGNVEELQTFLEE